MKRRCPESKYIGTGRLMNYRWQINSRGYANVIKAEGFWVDGLCYEISVSDEARLDISEGVATGAYEKHDLPVEIRSGDPSVYRRPTAWIVNHGGVQTVLKITDPQSVSDLPIGVEPEVLVYVSEEFVEEGQPWDEYVRRINAGLHDAMALGMDSAYVTNCIRPYIPADLKDRSSLREASDAD
jgi:hypothetical protein